ncbi:MAG: thermonuclease family protein [Candidatus Omnitrophota bacterium]
MARFAMVLVMLLLFICGCVTPKDDADYGVVKWVADGDTIKLFNGEYVRYVGVDTPELHHPKKHIYPEYYGKEAKKFNESLVLGKKVRLEFDVERYDKYGRLLAYVFVDGKFVNEELLKGGYAKTLFIPPNTKYLAKFSVLEEEAKKAKLGLWSISD